MLVDLIDFEEKIYIKEGKIKQKEICEISGINRYTISKAMNENDGIYNMRADAVYRLHNAYPYAMEIPEDFEYYSTASFVASLRLNGRMMYKDIAEKVGVSSTSLISLIERNHNFFLYDKKNIFSEFKTLYIPIYRGKCVFGYPEPEDIQVLVKKLDSLGNVKTTVSEEDFVVTMIMNGIKQHEINMLLKEARKIYKADSEKELMGKIYSMLGKKYKAKVVKLQ